MMKPKLYPSTGSVLLMSWVLLLVRSQQLGNDASVSNYCQTPQMPTNGQVSCVVVHISGINTQLLCTYTCDIGYKFKDVTDTSISRLCSNGVFSDGSAEPQCVSVCIEPELPPFATLSCESAGAGKVNCRAGCQSSHKLEIEPEGTYSCQTGGTWLPDLTLIPKCIRNQETILNSGLSVCTTWGHNHYRTFDNNIYTFSGHCKYVLAYMPNTFSIMINNDQTCTNSVNCKRDIEIYFGENVVVLKSMLNGTVVLWNNKVFTVPGSQGGTVIEKVGGYVTVRSSLKFNIKWDGSQSVFVKASDDLKGQISGLCGRFNGDPTDDFENDKGNVVTSVASFATSWKKSDLEAQICADDIQTTGCPVNTPQKSPAELFANSKCGDIVTDYIFKKCHTFVDPGPYAQACKADCCGDNSSQCMCETMEAYSRACLDQSIEIVWRRPNRCEIQCSEGMVYKECGSSCVPDCSNMEAVCSDPTCVDGCFCPDGWVLHKDKCIESTQCPCTRGNMEYQQGSLINEECNSCSCMSGKWNCTHTDCDASCSVMGDPHYTTFDGRRYDFMGMCSYYLVKTPDFNIVVDNIRCGNGDAACTKALSIDFKGLIIKLDHNHQLTVNGNEVVKLPYQTAAVQISMISSLFMQVVLSNSVSLMWDGRTRAYIKVPPSLKGQTLGLCGTYDGRQNNDFLTPQGSIETNTNLFGNQWKTSKDCGDMPLAVSSPPCETQSQRKLQAAQLCGQLKSSLFEACHDLEDVTPYYTDCTYDLCSCTENIQDCLCPSMGTYADSCAAKGVKIDWRLQVKECTLQCPGGQVYQVCSKPCEHTCYALAHNTDSMCDQKCVEGCSCPVGQSLNDKEECVLAEECPCIFDGHEYPAGFTTLKGTDICVCTDAQWQCTRIRPDNQNITRVQPLCPDNMEYSTCASSCHVTCENLGSAFTCAKDTDCYPGCVCKDGHVFDGNKCILSSMCPCYHGGQAYYEGEKFFIDCNECVCTNQNWQCEKNDCPSTCSAYGDSHYSTFDSRKFEFQGSCDYIMAKSTADNPNKFLITTTNLQCGTTGVTCSKGIEFISGIEGTSSFYRLQFVGGKTVKADSGSPFDVREVGEIVYVTTPFGVAVQWDKGTRVYISLSVQHINKVEGLCGNFNGDQNDDFQTRSGGLPVAKAISFGDSWRVHSTCEASKEVVDTCALEPQRRYWAKKKCSIIASELFEPCHVLVEPKEFIARCEFDACGCDMGGDCECFCTAVAAYTHECANKGMPIKWRSKNLCGLTCLDCQEYNPCISPCPKKTCDNWYNYSRIMESCEDEDLCFEGCDLHPCPDGQVYDSIVEPVACIPEQFCMSQTCNIGGRKYYEGERIYNPEVCRPDCEICNCRNGEVEHIILGTCVITPTKYPPLTTTTTRSPRPAINCTRSGWTGWMSASIPTYNNVGDRESVAALHEKYTFCDGSQITGIHCRVISQPEYGQYFGQIITCNVNSGLICNHKDQPGGLCLDYEVSFECDCSIKRFTTVNTTSTSSTIMPSRSSEAYPHTTTMCGWTQWMNSYTLTSLGDIESMSNLRLKYAFCAYPTSIMCRTVPDEFNPKGLQYDQVGQMAVTCDLNRGLVCLNSAQSSGQFCYDYEVAVKCEDDCSTGVTTHTTPLVILVKNTTSSAYTHSSNTFELESTVSASISHSMSTFPQTGYTIQTSAVPTFPSSSIGLTKQTTNLDLSTVTPKRTSPTSGSSFSAIYQFTTLSDHTLSSSPWHQSSEFRTEKITSALSTAPTGPTTEKTSTQKQTDYTPCYTSRMENNVCNFLGIFNKYVVGNDQMRASSSADVAFDAHNGRLRNTASGPTNGGAWMPRASDLNPHLIIDLEDIHEVAGVATQGRPGFPEWVKSFTVFTSQDGVDFVPYNACGAVTPKVFLANNDSNSIARALFDRQILARQIAIYPVEFVNNIAMRVDLLTCEDVVTTIADTDTPTTAVSTNHPSSTISTDAKLTETSHSTSSEYATSVSKEEFTPTTWPTTSTTHLPDTTSGSISTRCTKSHWLDLINRNTDVIAKGDREDLSTDELAELCHGGTVTKIKCYAVDGTPASQTGEIVECDLENGLTCSNSENGHTCKDYSITYWCECLPVTSSQTETTYTAFVTKTFSTQITNTTHSYTESTKYASETPPTTFTASSTSVPESSSTSVSKTSSTSVPKTSSTSVPESSSTSVPKTSSTSVPESSSTSVPKTSSTSVPESSSTSIPKTSSTSVPKTSSTSVPKTSTSAPESSSTSVPESSSTSVPKTSSTSVPESSSTLVPKTSSTSVPESSSTSVPKTSSTSVPKTSTSAPESSSTSVPKTSSTSVPESSSTSVPKTSSTSVPESSSTSVPKTSSTSVPESSSTSVPKTSSTSVPESSSTSIPKTSSTSVPKTSSTSVPKTSTSAPESSSTSVPESSSTSVPKTSSTSVPESSTSVPKTSSTSVPESSSTSVPKTSSTSVPKTSTSAPESSSTSVPKTSSTSMPESSSTSVPKTSSTSVPESSSTSVPKTSSTSVPETSSTSKTVTTSTLYSCVRSWSQWINRNLPTPEHGEHEIMSDEEKRQFCPNGRITAIECERDSGIKAESDPHSTCTVLGGLTCTNMEPIPGLDLPICYDYKVKYLCDCEVVPTTPQLQSSSATTPKVTVQCGWSPWLNSDKPYRSTSDPGDLETIETLKSTYRICPNIKDIECRVAGTSTSAANAGQKGVKCDTLNGLRCYNLDTANGVCYDYEVRVLCWDEAACAGATTPSSVETTSPVYSRYTTTSSTVVCPPGREWDPCAYKCGEVCHFMGHVTGACSEKSLELCVPGCKSVSHLVSNCSESQRLLDSNTCVDTVACTCLKPDGTVARPFDSWADPNNPCSRCSCFNNEVICNTANECSREDISTTVSQSPLCDWSSWINEDKPGTGNGDTELLSALHDKYSLCSAPSAVECRDANTLQDVRLSGQQVTCTKTAGLQCLNANNGGRCKDYEIRVFCPCQTVTDHTGASSFLTSSIASSTSSVAPPSTSSPTYPSSRTTPEIISARPKVSTTKSLPTLSSSAVPTTSSSVSLSSDSSIPPSSSSPTYTNSRGPTSTIQYTSSNVSTTQSLPTLSSSAVPSTSTSIHTSSDSSVPPSALLSSSSRSTFSSETTVPSYMTTHEFNRSSSPRSSYSSTTQPTIAPSASTQQRYTSTSSSILTSSGTTFTGTSVEIGRMCGWTDWMNDHTLDAQGDMEAVPHLRKNHAFCDNSAILSMRCRDVKTKKTPEELDQSHVLCDLSRGLVCINTDQQFGQCADYEVSFLCDPLGSGCIMETASTTEETKTSKMQVTTEETQKSQSTSSDIDTTPTTARYTLFSTTTQVRLNVTHLTSSTSTTSRTTGAKTPTGSLHTTAATLQTSTTSETSTPGFTVPSGTTVTSTDYKKSATTSEIPFTSADTTISTIISKTPINILTTTRGTAQTSTTGKTQTTTSRTGQTSTTGKTQTTTSGTGQTSTTGKTQTTTSGIGQESTTGKTQITTSGIDLTSTTGKIQTARSGTGQTSPTDKTQTTTSGTGQESTTGKTQTTTRGTGQESTTGKTQTTTSGTGQESTTGKTQTTTRGMAQTTTSGRAQTSSTDTVHITTSGTVQTSTAETPFTQPTIPPVCENLLTDAEPLNVLYSSRIASSSLSKYSGPEQSRIDSKTDNLYAGAWIPLYNSNKQWIRVEFRNPVVITAITTQGRDGAQEWIKTYTAIYSPDGDHFYSLLAVDEQSTVFTGNFDSNTKRTEKVKPTEALMVIIQPKTWQERIALRFELAGCLNHPTFTMPNNESRTITPPTQTVTPPPQTGTSTPQTVTPPPQTPTPACVSEHCEQNMGLQDRRIRDDMLSASSFRDTTHVPVHARLGHTRSWMPSASDISPYIQVNLMTSHVISGITTQGRADAPLFVRTYKVNYSIDGTTWNPYRETYGQDKIFYGNWDSTTAVRQLFQHMIRAQYIRIIPQTWNNEIAFRFEIHGCLNTSYSYPTASPTVSTTTVTAAYRESTNVYKSVVTAGITDCIEWDQWLDLNHPNLTNRDEIEPIDDLIANSLHCKNPMAIDCRPEPFVRQQTAIVSCNLWEGLKCLVSDGNEPVCNNYKVKLGCVKNTPECMPQMTNRSPVPVCYPGLDTQQCPETCPQGFFCNGTKCVLKSACPCSLDGKIVLPDGIQRNKNCDICQCLNGEIMCAPAAQCPPCNKATIYRNASSCDCQCLTCKPDEFQCGDGSCLPENRRCDCIIDCVDDELGCDVFTLTSPVIYQNTTVPVNNVTEISKTTSIPETSSPTTEVCFVECKEADKPSCPVGSELVETLQACNCTGYACLPFVQNNCSFTHSFKIENGSAIELLIAQEAVYEIGERWSDGLCKSCECTNGTRMTSEIICTERECPHCKLGEERVNKTSSCCGKCKKNGCVLGRKVYKAGEELPSSKKCYTATCKKSIFDEGFIIQETQKHCEKVENLPTCKAEMNETERYDATGCCPKCILQQNSCQTCSSQLVAGNPNNTIGHFQVVLDTGVTCQNKNPIPDLKQCGGYCSSTSLYREVLKDFKSNCSCCQPSRTVLLPVQLHCSDGQYITKEYIVPESCACMACSGGT